MTGFDASDKIVDISAYMHANHIIIHSFERPECTLSGRKKIFQIESLHVEILTIKVKC
jgi:hypothetical protein